MGTQQGTQQRKYVPGCCAAVTGITASWRVSFRNKFWTIIFVSFENDLAKPTISVSSTKNSVPFHYYGINYLQKLTWQYLQDLKCILALLLQLTPASTQTADIWSISNIIAQLHTFAFWLLNACATRIEKELTILYKASYCYQDWIGIFTFNLQNFSPWNALFGEVVSLMLQYELLK